MAQDEFLHKLQKDVEMGRENNSLRPVTHSFKKGKFTSKRPKMKMSKETLDLTGAAIQKNVEVLIDMGRLLRPGEVA